MNKHWDPHSHSTETNEFFRERKYSTSERNTFETKVLIDRIYIVWSVGDMLPVYILLFPRVTCNESSVLCMMASIPPGFKVKAMQDIWRRGPWHQPEHRDRIYNCVYKVGPVQTLFDWFQQRKTGKLWKSLFDLIIHKTHGFITSAAWVASEKCRFTAQLVSRATRPNTSASSLIPALWQSCFPFNSCRYHQWMVILLPSSFPTHPDCYL